MNKNARWIWYPGEFEIYHSILVHSRREEYGIDYPCMWSLPNIFPRIDFKNVFSCDKNTTVLVKSTAIGRVIIDDIPYPLDKDISVNAGKHKISVEVIKTDGLPAIFIDCEFLKTDNSWLAALGASEDYLPVGDTPHYYNWDITPENFIFSYESINFISEEIKEKGILYDFGKEYFGNIIIKNVSSNNSLTVYYGESKEEALDTEYTIIYETVSGKEQYRLKSRAFRYIYIISDKKEDLSVSAEYEYLPLNNRAEFICENNKIKQIFDICAHTFHLNSREFYFDGIKRDRWVWAGDAYQSFMINNYLYFDTEITKRTITALIGKPPYVQHINKINDYSAYVILSVYDYYYSTGDKDYIKFIFPRLKDLYNFIVLRLDDNGFVYENKGDWIFIDWANFDKSGPLCAEQILLWKTHKCMASLAELIGHEDDIYYQRADSLKALIVKNYWNDELGAFIDTYTSGKNNVTRHANIFAVIYDFVDDNKKKIIYEKVLTNENVEAINTPFFKFFELMAICEMGGIDEMQRLLESYWGGMLDLGATTVWEAYNPQKSGIEHYSMYLKKYMKSLCHAWGAGPIFLLGRYCLGVKAEDIAYKKFSVTPRFGKYKSVNGKVPVLNGEVSIKYDGRNLFVKTNTEGGYILHKGRKIPLEKNIEKIIENYNN